MDFHVHCSSSYRRLCRSSPSSQTPHSLHVSHMRFGCYYGSLLREAPLLSLHPYVWITPTPVTPARTAQDVWLLHEPLSPSHLGLVILLIRPKHTFLKDSVFKEGWLAPGINHLVIGRHFWTFYPRWKESAMLCFLINYSLLRQTLLVSRSAPSPHLFPPRLAVSFNSFFCSSHWV